LVAALKVRGPGTAAHITASTGAVTILLSQLEMAGPTSPARMRDFWRRGRFLKLRAALRQVDQPMRSSISPSGRST
jgi:hypothetical protein